MTTHTDRIRQMAQEATAYADAMDGSGRMAGRAWSDVRDEYFAQLVAEDCAREMRFEFTKMSPTIAEAAIQGESVKHVVEVCAAAAVFNVRLRYSLKD